MYASILSAVPALVAGMKGLRCAKFSPRKACTHITKAKTKKIYITN